MAARPSRIDEVRHGLLADLSDGSTPVGTKLPNEQELATRFGVSRATVREAVGGLVEGGYLLRRHGSGTFVSQKVERMEQSLWRLSSFSADMRSRGRSLECHTPDLALVKQRGQP